MMAVVAMAVVAVAVVGQGRASKNGGVVVWFGKSDYTTLVV